MSTFASHSTNQTAYQTPKNLNAATLNSEIFIVDDETLVIDTLTHHLNTAGFHNIHGFEDSGEAIDTLRFVQPDIILTDVYMPDVSGSFLTKLIRTFTHLKNVPILVITSDARPETEVTLRRKGADVVLAKPVHPDVLVQNVVEALKRAEHHSAQRDREFAIEQQQHAQVSEKLKVQESRLRNLCRKSSG